MASTLSVLDYIMTLQNYYNTSADHFLNLPYNYSLLQGEIMVEADSSPATTATTTLMAFNNRGKKVIQLSRTATTDTDVPKSIATGSSTLKATEYEFSFDVYLYDVLWNKLKMNSWGMGLFRDMYSYEDSKLITGSMIIECDIQYGEPVYLMRDRQLISFYFYSPSTGALRSRADFYTSANDLLDYARFSRDLWDILNDPSMRRGFSNATSILSLSAITWLDFSSLEELEFIQETSDSYEIRTTLYEDDPSLGALKQTSKLTYVNNPIDRLNRVSVFDTGNWSNYPLGSSPAECAARYLQIPYNNKNYTTEFPNAGMMQFITAVEQDVLYAFINNPANANVNYADLRSMAQAVTSYTRVMAANICSAKKLPRAVVPYIAAKIEYHLFYTKTLPADIESALNTVLGYVLQDFSINDSVANARDYYEKCRDITSYFGTFYTTRGTNVERLGANAENFLRVMEAYREYQRLFLEIAYVRELNQLAVTAKSTGSIELLDKTKTVYPRLQSMVYLGMNGQSMICSDVTISISNSPAFRVSANYIKRLEIS